MARSGEPEHARARSGPARWLGLGLAGLLLVAGGAIAARQVLGGEPPPAPTTVPPTSAVAEGSVAERVARALAPAMVRLEVGEAPRGAGVIYDPGGHILTTDAVVEGASDVTVRLADGTSLQGRVLGADTRSGVAVVKVDRGNLPVARLATGAEVDAGDLAIAVRGPGGPQETVTSGVVSAVNQSQPGRAGSQVVLITDVPSRPGDAGTALADDQGRVIGISHAVLSGAGGGGGRAVAIPIDMAARVAGQLAKGEPVRHAFLGVQLRNAPGGSGALVQGVAAGSPAASARLRAGDRVTRFNGEPVRSGDQLAALVLLAGPDASVTLELVRGGRPVRATVQLRAATG